MAAETGPPPGAERWRVRVRGVIGPVAAHAFSGFTVSHQGAVSTLEGALTPAVGLGQLLVDLQSLGLEVIDVERIADPAPDRDQGPDSGGLRS